MKKITLYDEETPYGIGTEVKQKNIKVIWCDKFTETSMTTAFRAMSSEIRLTHQAEVWKNEYDYQQYAEIDGQKYRIESASRAKSTMKIKLMLSRG